MLRDFLAYYRPHKRLLILDFGSAVLSGLLSLGFPLAVATFVDELLPAGDWQLIVLAVLGLGTLYLLNTGLMTIVAYWGHVLGIAIETEMRRKAFDHLQTLSFQFFDNNKTGHVVARLTKDLEEIGEVAHHGPEDLLVAVMTFVGALILMFMIHVPLATMALMLCPLTAYLVIHFGGRMTANWESQFDRVGAFNARIEENVGGARLVRAFGTEEHERRLFTLDNELYQALKLSAYRMVAATLALNYLGMRLLQVSMLVAGAWFVGDGSLTIGAFVGFLLLIDVFYQPLEKIAAVVETYPKGIAGFKRYLAFLRTKPEIADAPFAKSLAEIKGDIRFENVSFGYRANQPTLHDISFHVHAGETVAFVGSSGAGKSTLLSLLPRFYEVVSGRISIDDQDIRAVTLKSLRQQIGLVAQDTFLFAGTVRENIAYGRLGASDADVIEAARRARLESLLEALPQGLDTIVGERGVKLSGGQRQRIAIARVFLKDPPILLLDEATSALDSETERAIQRSLTELSAGRTTLVVAHRLATVANADRIIVVENGRIVESGTADELLGHQEGRYTQLHAAQLA